MSKLYDYLDSLNIMNRLTEKDLDAPLVRQSARLMDEFSEECFESRRQSVADFINLAIDCDRDTERRHISERLSSTGHAMYLLEILEDALLIVRDDPRCGGIYYKILNARYFDCYCKSNEDACLRAEISPATYYRHIKAAQKYYAAVLWCIVIPDMVIAAERPPRPELRPAASA